MGKKRNLHMIPIAVCILCPLTFVITFIIAVQLDHVTPAFPYISDTGALAPESCIFTQLLNITSVLLAVCVYIRHLQVKKFAHFRHRISLKLRANTLATYIGFFACLGMSIVGNFQVSTVWQVHYVGALLCFVGGSIYFIFQTIFSYHMSKLFNSKCVFYSRCILCVISFFFVIFALVPGILSKEEYTGTNTYQWTPKDGGWLWHVLSAAAEWLLAVWLSALVLTFLPEFKSLTINSPVLKIEGISL